MLWLGRRMALRSQPKSACPEMGSHLSCHHLNRSGPIKPYVPFPIPSRCWRQFPLSPATSRSHESSSWYSILSLIPPCCEREVSAFSSLFFFFKHSPISGKWNMKIRVTIQLTLYLIWHLWINYGCKYVSVQSPICLAIIGRQFSCRYPGRSQPRRDLKEGKIMFSHCQSILPLRMV